MRRVFLAVAGSLALIAATEEAGKIMRPADHSALPGDQVDIVATAPEGALELDGKPVTAEQPFPNVFHSVTKVSPGPHKLALIWKDGRKEIEFFSGSNPPSGFQEFRFHPPVKSVQCTQCHELTRRGRFHFKDGACFSCHTPESFAKVHTHTSDTLRACGLCHNAHGSVTKAHLLFAKETACKQCHN